MARILIIDDDPNLSRTIDQCLRRDSHKCYLAHTGEDGLRLFRQLKPDAIILDLMLPDMNGLEVCERLWEMHIRQETDPPLILILSAKTEQPDHWAGHHRGAVAYLNKPFEPNDLSAQLWALLNQFRREQETKERGIIETYHFQINQQYQQVKVRRTSEHDWVSVDCSALEVKILHTFVSRPGRVWERDQLIEAAWGYGAEMNDRAIDSHITRLRRKIAAVLGDRQFIITVRSLGYKFEDDHD